MDAEGLSCTVYRTRLDVNVKNTSGFKASVLSAYTYQFPSAVGCADDNKVDYGIPGCFERQ